MKEMDFKREWVAKPTSSRWTDEQWAAIAADGSRLLVAAAAGSGKTAVLVERIISRIADERQPLAVDAILVATFTKAAAAEMKERIRHALEAALEAAPDSRHLQRQLALLPRAAITTLHSFCLEVIERYGAIIDLDPGFRIANETEAELLRMDTLDELFEETYTREEAREEGIPLSLLAERFGGERSDEPLHRLVLELHDFAASHPWPQQWLRDKAGRFRVHDAADLLQTLWVASLRTDALLLLRGAAGQLDAALRVASMTGGPTPYISTLEEDISSIARLLETFENALSWSSWQEAVSACGFGRLKPCKGDDYDPILQDKVKAFRDAAKKTVAKLAEDWLVRSPDKYAQELRLLAPDMEALAELTIDFGQRYEQAKRSKGLLDFGDLEHYALRILRSSDSTPEHVVPSDAALAYRERFKAIYLDEYQDTNEVQEAIVSLIARETPGNVFMVGDVKQSIYRFRLAEPGLFLAKYRTYDIWTPDTAEKDREGLRIDLARNFRSRRPVIEAVNRLFRLIMREPVGEMTYDERAELVYGNGYPETSLIEGAERKDYGVEFIVIDRGAGKTKEDSIAQTGEYSDKDAASSYGHSEEEETSPSTTEEDLETAQLEARCIAAEIRRLMGGDGSERDKLPFAVYDGKAKLFRPLQYRDVVILLRAATSLAPAYLEELKAAGIPAYADLATGYFAATEVETMLSLLSIIDNPRQDIPLAGVLRSPIVGMHAEELARIRLYDRAGSFWDALCAAADDEASSDSGSPLTVRLASFLSRLEQWRNWARRAPLGELIERLYRETGYYDFVGGLPGGVQRQANLRAMVDRARAYERTSRFRGLFRFLRFLGRMRDNGADLGAARAIGESEDVVRIVSIHKSKGLEFPVVFVAGLGQKFNRQDLAGMFLKHKALGFGPRMVETDTRVAYPTLPQLAIRRKLAAETLAEEMRVLYVALTRPKEKLILIGTSKDAGKDWDKWTDIASAAEERLPDYAVAAASRYLDWLGPAAVLAEAEWDTRLVPSSQLGQLAQTVNKPDEQESELHLAVTKGEQVPVPPSPEAERIRRALSWTYRHEAAAHTAAHTSITALKEPTADRSAGESWHEERTHDEDGTLFAKGQFRSFRLRRPKFLSEAKLTPAERGTAFHLVMQHLPLRAALAETDVEALLESLVDKRILSPSQREATSPTVIAAFCRTALYERLLAASQVWREIPFTYAMSAANLRPEAFDPGTEDKIIVRGVVDCLFEEPDGLVLIDYKTDALGGIDGREAAEKHRFQVEKYGEAVMRIVGRPVKEAYVYFFDGGHAVRLR